jgi:glutathione S-transferase
MSNKLTLFYATGTCSLACHLALQFADAKFDLHQVDLRKGEQRSPEYLKLNPKGVVPTLRLETGEVVTEAVAILAYIAKRYPDAGLVPEEGLQFAHTMELLSWLAGTMHGAHFAAVFRPARFSDEEAHHAAIAEKGMEGLRSDVERIEKLLADKSWAADDQFTIADAYLLVLYRWAMGKKLTANAPNWTAYFKAWTGHEHVRATFEREGIRI